MWYLVLIFLGGGLGAVSRFYLSSFISSKFNIVFPLGTFVVNVLGSFVMGFFAYLSENFLVSSDVRAFVMIGFIGAFTTFSTFSLESLNLLRDGEIKYFIFNLLFSLMFGLLFLILGYVLSELIVGRGR